MITEAFPPKLGTAGEFITREQQLLQLRQLRKVRRDRTIEIQFLKHENGDVTTGVARNARETIARIIPSPIVGRVHRIVKGIGNGEQKYSPGDHGRRLPLPYWRTFERSQRARHEACELVVPEIQII